MKIKAEKQQWLAALGRCVSVASKRGSLPILACARIRSFGGVVRIDATDLIVTSRTDFEAEGDDGDFAVDAKDLFDRVKMMPDGPVILDESDGKLTIKAPKCSRRYSVGAQYAADFPELDEPPTGGVDVSADALAGVIQRTHFAISQDDSRAQLASALVTLSGEEIRMVATDGHRLNIARESIDCGGEPVGMVIPRKGIDMLRKQLSSDTCESVRVSNAGKDIHFMFEDYSFSVRPTASEYVAYEGAVPDTSGATKCTVNRVALLDSVRAVLVSADSAASGIAVTFDDGEITIQSKSPEAGDAVDKVECEYGGDRVTVGVSGKYTVDALSAISDETILVAVGGSMDPLSIVPVDDCDSFLAVIMPMRI